jgi:hypothetical protein
MTLRHTVIGVFALLVLVAPAAPRWLSLRR